jgi:predicted AlkP superfamily phosphohydrolase/phosphomutase
MKKALLLLGIAAALGGLFWLRSRPAQPAPAGGRRPLVVIGIDGGEWKVVRRLWAKGKLPHLKAIAERGATATLRTAYNSSPVIWTTIATGVTPPVHGITDFVVPTPKGDVPISSAVRKVPALWNMLTRAGRRVAVLGWWGSWPAEEVNGVVVSDRALLDLDARVSPASYLPEFLAGLREADADPGLFRDEEAERRDRIMARVAEKLARQGYDLILVYFRSPDITSHHYWKYWEPDAFPGIDPRELAVHRDRVPRVYEAVDREIGRILEAAPKETNVLVLSDHGFHAAKREDVRVFLDMDAVLERLGYLKRAGAGIDLTRTRVYTFGTPPFRREKMLRFTVRPEERNELRRRLEEDLTAVTNERGEPVFTVRDVKPRRGEEGDLAAVVSLERVTRTLRVRGEPFAGAVQSISRLSGTHTRSTHGIFLAAGPDIDPAADLEGIHIHDIAPTLLYALGLPVGEDFAGRPRRELFTEDFRRAHPLRTVRSWGVMQEGGNARASEADEKLLDELRSLGYIR